MLMLHSTAKTAFTNEAFMTAIVCIILHVVESKVMIPVLS